MTYEILKEWQQGIGALLGFFALTVAALINFALNRRRDAALRREEALSVAAALYGEIILLRREVALLARMVAQIYMNRGVGSSSMQIDSHFVEAHTLPEPQLYKALGSKIGLLEPNLILAITEFYQNFQEVRSWLPLLVENDQRGYDYGVLYVLHPARNAVIDIKPAMRLIEKKLGIGFPAEDPDFKAAQSAIHFEEEQNEWHAEQQDAERKSRMPVAADFGDPLDALRRARDS